jgi:hypothetical protein
MMPLLMLNREGFLQGKIITVNSVIFGLYQLLWFLYIQGIYKKRH